MNLRHNIESSQTIIDLLLLHNHSNACRISHTAGCCWWVSQL